ncbi:MAG: hypothetical protein Q7T86_09465 [Hyphomicrobiaceae bacterium]|nr:hypothetical protein [Hyphomicrobiaceae bacterium]
MKGLLMKTVLAALFAATVLPAAAAHAAGPLPGSSATVVATAPGIVQAIGERQRRTSGDCKPYNGPYGYYGNPYCEGGLSRYGNAGGYEVDLTRFFDERYYTDRRDRRRWR